jgi:nucleoside-diphosphate kinase
MEEKTLVLIKPDGLVKSLTGNIITTLSETKLKIVGAKIVKVKRELAEKHYSDLKKSLIKKFGDEKGNEIFESTLEYIQGKFHTDRVFALVYKGEDAIKKIRELAGETNPERASPTSIRGKYGRIHSETKVFENVIHCSDSVENAEREIALWFKKNEIVE